MEDEEWLKKVLESGSMDVDKEEEEEKEEEMAMEEDVPMEEGKGEDLYALPAIPPCPPKEFDIYDKETEDKTKQLKKDVLAAAKPEPRILAKFEDVRDYIDHRLQTSQPNVDKKKEVRAYLGIKLPHDLYRINSTSYSFFNLLGSSISDNGGSFKDLLVSLRTESKSHSARKRFKAF